MPHTSLPDRRKDDRHSDGSEISTLLGSSPYLRKYFNLAPALTFAMSLGGVGGGGGEGGRGEELRGGGGGASSY